MIALKFLLITFLFAAIAMRAETGTRTNIRKEILSSFQYRPADAQNSDLKTQPRDPEPGLEKDPAVIVLPKYEVKARPLPRGLTEAVAKSRALGPQNHSKFGTGIHEKDFGKVRLSAVTVLYIPIFVGLRW